MNNFFYTWTAQQHAHPLHISDAEGDEYITDDGSRIYDFISTSFQASFGHSNPLIIQKITRQLNQMPICSPKAVFPLKSAVSRGLIELLGFDRGKMFFTVSGAEAVENALKIARHRTGRPIILSRQQSYHGASLGAMSVSGDWRSDHHLTFDQGTRRIPEPYDDPTAAGVRQVIQDVGAENIAAVIVETISGTNGVVIPGQEWVQSLRKICTEHQILLIMDEVLTGFYRCQRVFAFQQFQVAPDMVCMSKAISGGYVPFGAVWVDQPIADFYQDNVLANGLTSYAHPLGLAASAAVIQQIVKPEFVEHLRQLEIVFRDQIGQLGRRFTVSASRVNGMLAAIEFADRQLPDWKFWVQRGLYLYTKGNMMILAPPLTTQAERLERAFSDLADGLQH